MIVFVAAGERVALASGRHTALEAIHRSNMAKITMRPNSFFNRMLLEKDEGGRFKDIPEEIRANWPFYTGTFAMIGAKGRPLGSSMESQYEYAGSMKTVVVIPGEDEVGLVDTMVTCDHGFAPDGKPFLPLFNAKTEKPIRSDEEIGETDTVLLKLNGQKRRYRVQERNGGVLEAVGDENTFSYVGDFAALGLLGRVHYGVYGKHYVGLYVRPSDRRGVVTDASDAIVVRDNAPIVRGVEQSGAGAPLEAGGPEQLRQK